MKRAVSVGENDQNSMRRFRRPARVFCSPRERVSLVAEPRAGGRRTFGTTPAARSLDYGQTVNCSPFDKFVVLGAGGSRNHVCTQITAPEPSGVPSAPGWLTQ
jgi:hypothetical protein